MKTFSEIIPVGKKFVSTGRTITEGEFALLHALIWVSEPFHVDKEYCKKESPFGERILGGSIVLSLALSLAVNSAASKLKDEVFYPEGLNAVCLLGYDTVRFSSPVKPGDTITVQSEVVDVRQTSNNPRRCVTTLKHVIFNQRQEQVASFGQAILQELTN